MASDCPPQVSFVFYRYCVCNVGTLGRRAVLAADLSLCRGLVCFHHRLDDLREIKYAFRAVGAEAADLEDGCAIRREVDHPHQRIENADLRILHRYGDFRDFGESDEIEPDSSFCCFFSIFAAAVFTLRVIIPPFVAQEDK